jgi:hypothetical protein
VNPAGGGGGGGDDDGDDDDDGSEDDYAPGADPYATGRKKTDYRAGYEKTGEEVYWEMRVSSSNVVHWLMHFYGGGPMKVDQETDDFESDFLHASNIDAALEESYLRGGWRQFKKTLRKNRSIEVSLNTLAVKHSVKLTGDKRMGEHLKAVRLPGKSHVLPQEIIEDGMSASQNLYKQENRVGGRGSAETTRQRRAGQFARGKAPGKGGRGGAAQAGAGAGSSGAPPAGSPGKGK